MRPEIYSRDLKTPEDIAEYNKAEISRVFADSFGESSKAGIAVSTLTDSPFRSKVIVGMPYKLSKDMVPVFPCADDGTTRYDFVDVLVVGAYAKNPESRAHKDKSTVTEKIPLKNIISFKRLELSDLLSE